MHELLHRFLAQIPELSPPEREQIGGLLEVTEYPKGTELICPGQGACYCYFILQGCIRQYQLIEGKEKTTGFFTEGQTVVDFNSYAQQQPVDLFWVCLEDCVLLVGAMDQERSMYDEFPQLEVITRRMMAEDFGDMQQQWTAFMTATPEQRYQHLLDTRPDLLQRVPQHQLASYLGVTPESLSRIRRRLREQEKREGR